MEVPTPDVPSTKLTAPRLGLHDPGVWLHWLDEAFAGTPARLWHSRAVWHRVAAARRHELQWLHPERYATLELAALLHDVGRAVDPYNLEPHGFAGARFLDGLGLHEVAAIVAHHSGARYEARDRQMTHLDVWQPDAELVAIVTYIDRTTSPRGESVSLDVRRAELAERYGAASPNVRWFDDSLDEARLGARLCSGLRRFVA